MYLYPLAIGDTIETLDHLYQGTVDGIDFIAQDDGQPEDMIHYTDADGVKRSARRWLVRRLAAVDLDEMPF